jgi:drug/metabolite transporter (DMT)-like permease
MSDVIREKFEKLGSLFLVVFSIGLAVVLAADGMERVQWLGSVLAVAGSMTLAITVRAWPKAVEARTED